MKLNSKFLSSLVILLFAVPIILYAGEPYKFKCKLYGENGEWWSYEYNGEECGEKISDFHVTYDVGFGEREHTVDGQVSISLSACCEDA